MYKFTDLPDWCLTGQKPAFYDTESATAIEQTAKLYGAIKTLIEESEKAINEIDKACKDFKTGVINDQETFKEDINTIMHNYIAMIDEKVKTQDKVIEENITYIRENITDGVDQILTEMKESGELDEIIGDTLDGLDTRVDTLENTEYTLELEEGTENLILVKTVKEGE